MMEKTEMILQEEKFMKEQGKSSWVTMAHAVEIGFDEVPTPEFLTYLVKKAAAYDRLMSGGKKTLKEWANILGKPVAIDIENRLCWFPKKPEIGLTTWIWYDEQFGCFGEYLPKNLIDFNGDWTTSLTLPDGWEEK